MSQNNIPSLEETLTLTDPVIMKLKAYIDRMYQTRNAQGQFDFSVMRDYATMNLGSNWNLLNAYLLEQQHVLADMKAKLDEGKGKAIDDIKRGRQQRGYEVQATEMKFMIDAHPEVVLLNRQLAKQTSIVHYLDRQVRSMEYFTNNVKTLAEIHRHVIEYGASAK